MKKYVCSICGYIYDESVGIPNEGIAAGTKWEDVPQDWVCPLCGATKADFTENQIKNQPSSQLLHFEENDGNEMRALSLGELSALCSNLSKGCEKQYRTEEADLFNKLAEYYKSKGDFVDEKQFDDLNELIQQDLSFRYTEANLISKKDRGALRALAWGEKVTRMLNSLLRRFEKEKETFLENTNIYVCDICGFVFIGEDAPDICPVCKVPKMKIMQIQRG